MKRLILLFSIILLLSGCGKDEFIYTPVKQNCAAFPLDEFKKADDYNITNIKIEDINGEKNVKIELNVFLGFVENYKKIKSDYNTLIDELNKFQKKD